MSDTRDTHQEQGRAGGRPGEEGGDARVLQAEEEEERVGGVGGDADGGPVRPRDHDHQIQHEPHQPGSPPQGGLGQRQETPRWYKKRILKVKSLLLLPFRKINKFYVRRCRSTYYYYGDDPGGCCCRCFRPPPAISPPRFMKNPVLPGCRNPNPSSYEFVKYMIESNDFYAPNCNVHGGASGCPHNSGHEEE